MKKSTKNNTDSSVENNATQAESPRSESESIKKTVSEKQTPKNSPIKKEKSAPSKKADKKSRYGIAISLSFLIALIATGLAAYDFLLLNAQVPVNAQLISMQESVEKRINKLEQQLQNTESQLAAETQARAGAQSERAAINSALQGINEKLGRSTLAWRMAEVEYLLTVANHRLTLAQDRQTATAVFETADSRLKAIADPSLLKVRKKIASELTALRAVPDVDIPGLAVQIGSLAESVEQLPLLDKKRLAVATENQKREAPENWQKIPAAVWNDIKSLVQVRRHQQPTEPLLPPKQAWFLYQNLQLKLEQARLAALRQNTSLYTQSLTEVSQWLDSYYEVESAAVISMQTTLTKLREIELQPPMPDVSGSLRELRSVMNARPTANTAPVSKSANKTNAETTTP